MEIGEEEVPVSQSRGQFKRCLEILKDAETDTEKFAALLVVNITGAVVEPCLLALHCK